MCTYILYILITMYKGSNAYVYTGNSDSPLMPGIHVYIIPELRTATQIV